MLQPGMNDYDYVTAMVSVERVVHGMIAPVFRDRSETKKDRG